MIGNLNKLVRLSSVRTFSVSIRSFCAESPTLTSKPSNDDRRLLRELCSKIRFSGPITIAEYMRELLINPVHGFYIDKDVIGGSSGHFVTSPEISQMFGESVGVWLVNEWMKMGEPSKFQLVELGPGNGTLMTDILRTFSKLCPQSMPGLTVQLVEISPTMRKHQQRALGIQETDRIVNTKDGLLESQYGCKVGWYDHIWDVPRKFSFFIAHEFFDALAVNKFKKVEDEWREVLVDVDESGDRLRYVISRNATPACVLLQQDNVKDLVKDRTMVEMSPSAWTMAKMMSERIVEDGGGALIADYGHDGDDGDTLRAFRNHQQVDPLELPGSADITADVDFSLLRPQLSPDCAWFGPVTQSHFLHSCGIGTRCQQLLASCDSSQQQLVYDSFFMLTSPDKMGSRFKFVSLFPKSMQEIHSKYPPVGFEENIS